MSQREHDEPTTGIDPLRELGKQLPWDRPDAARREAVRSSLLVAAADAPPHRAGGAWLVGAGFVAGALAAAAVALLLARSPAAPSTAAPSPVAAAPVHERYAQIESSSVAALEHTTAATPSGTDEVVRVHAGTVRLAVPSVRAGDRVRTRTGDAEIEGTGAYEVVVANDKLTSVRVSAGTAKVIVDGRTIVLASGQTWTAPIVTADLSPAESAQPAAPAAPPVAQVPAPVAAITPPPARPRIAHSLRSEPAQREERTADAPAPSVTPAPAAIEPAPERAPAAQPTAAPTPPVSLTSPTEQHFRAGWALLRENKYAAAADELAVAAAGDEPLASDARYFRAVALTKAGRAPEAEAALVAFLDKAGVSSPRRGRAAIMLGRLIAARGDTASARSWFTSALRDPDGSVAGAARAELAKLP